jgi:glycosyltransferase involved in cell wall biosynthesis
MNPDCTVPPATGSAKSHDSLGEVRLAANSSSKESGSSVPVSVVTVTYNNAQGLVKTLDSLRDLQVRPSEILVVDGGSGDGTLDVLREYAELIPELRYVSERDNGIYAAMNKGKRLAAHPLIHYLNAGDIVLGEPYRSVGQPTRLPVEICTTDDQVGWKDFIKLRGFGYCHQGLLFPASHPDYDTRYRIAGDFDVIMRSFPDGLFDLPVSSHGRVRYYLGGVSSQRSARLDREVVTIAARNRGLVTAGSLLAVVVARRLLPRPLRRMCARLVQVLR